MSSFWHVLMLYCIGLGHFHLLVPYRLAGGTISLLAVRLSVSPSHFSFPDFSLPSFEILKFGIWICLDIIQIKFEFFSCFTYFYRSYCPLLKFSFPDFSLSSIEILTWSLVYEFVMTYTAQVPVWSHLTYFYRSYCPLLKFSFPDFSLPSIEILTWSLVY